jgi:tRNA pseudouridine55 synthase
VIAAEAPEFVGLLAIDKPAGPTSHDVVAAIRRLTGVRRVGHGGTLDPFASGILPVFLGHATRIVEYHLADDKRYRAIVAFGARSTTDDLDGELTPTDGLIPDRAAVEIALDALRGPIVQVPPDYSAVRIAGRHAYELARRGEKPELRPRSVTIRSLELVAWNDADPERPSATLEISCSAGTYIRALARDLGEGLGCGAYLAGLVRTASGTFDLGAAHPFDTVRAKLAAGATADLLLPPDVGLDAFPLVSLAPDELQVLTRGQSVRVPPDLVAVPPAAGFVRVRNAAGGLVAIARLADGRLAPEKVLVEAGAVAPA